MEKIKNIIDTMELIHYIDKLKNKIFVFVVSGKVDIRNIIPDIIILQSFSMKVILVIGYKEFESEDGDLRILNESMSNTILEVSGILKKNFLDPLPAMGTEVFAKKVRNSKLGKVVDFDLETINFALSHHKIPLIAPLGVDNRGKYHRLDEKEVALALGSVLNAQKIFLISDDDEIKIGGKKYQYLAYNQVKEILEKEEIDDNVREILKYSIDVIKSGIKEFAVMKGETGNIYTEVLTYDISGTLISKADDEVIRKADMEDVSTIYLLMKNEMERNNILPVTEEEIEDEIDNYIVYDIEGSIVAVGKLTYYNKAAEIAKIATLPRYQGGQKAKEICKDLVEKAIYEGMDYVFGLTINPVMMGLFTGIGFEEIERESLPKAWKDHYDFSRPSKAFKLDLMDEKKDV